MKLHEITENRTGRAARKRVGRGTGSGRGKTSGRGTKGQNSRSGGGVHPTFEGGQLPLTKRLPKLRGFKRPQKIHYTPVNLEDLELYFEAGAEVTLEDLAARGLIDDTQEPVVLLGRGELSKRLTVQSHRVSGAARAAIEAQGGAVHLQTLTGK